MGPKLPISQEIHAQKYRGEGETFEEAMTRIANALKDSDSHFRSFREILRDMRFLPAGRVQAAMGSPKRVTAYNCFVSGTIPDSMDGIMTRAAEAAQTMRMGGGIGYDFSTIRPRGDRIVSLDSQASGPVSFMGIFDAVCGTIASAGERRGAQMGVLRVDHPDIEEFIEAKQNSDRLTNFNISIAATDEFMRAVEEGTAFPLRWDGRIYRWVDARNLWEKIMRSTWDWAEPGILFIDTINRLNNLWYCETIAATNPCAEQPLPPYGACLLGSFNLVKYVSTNFSGEHWFDWALFAKDIPIVVRAMDNIVDRAIYPMPEQEREAKSKRRMGLGVTGLANAAEALGYRYGDPEFLSLESTILGVLANEAYRASALLAAEKGPFPLFSHNEYLAGEFVQRLNEDVLALIRQHGIRNSHLTSIAPTGTISLSADNVSSGIEPVFSHSFERTINFAGGKRTELVEDYGVREFGVRGRTAADLTADDHLNVLTTAAYWMDSAVSKTCNVNPDMPWEEFKDIYMKAWKGGAKGVTTFNPNGKRMGILKDTSSAQTESEGAACYIDPETGKKSCE